MPSAEYQKVRRDKIRGGPSRTPEPCPSRAAIRRHEYHKEPLCDLCEVERKRINAENYQRRKLKR
jgi:hypothetical protein